MGFLDLILGPRCDRGGRHPNRDARCSLGGYHPTDAAPANPKPLSYRSPVQRKGAASTGPGGGGGGCRHACCKHCPPRPHGLGPL